MDALSTLLMVIIFVLLVFVLAQAFLSVSLSGRDQALEQLHRQVAELSDMLAGERTHTADLGQSVDRLNASVRDVTVARVGLYFHLFAVAVLGIVRLANLGSH